MDILFIEDNDTDAALIEKALSAAPSPIHLHRVTTIRQAIQALQSGNPPPYDLVLSDLHLPDGGPLSLLDYIRELDLPLPVVVITGQGDEETAISILKAGADDYILKRDDFLSRLPAILTEACQHYQLSIIRNRHPLRVLYADPNPTDIDLTRFHLKRYAPHIRLKTVQTAGELLNLLVHSDSPPTVDLLLLDFHLPDTNALDLMKELHQVHQIDVPVVIITGQGKEDIAIQALKLGAVDYVVKSSGYLHRLPAVLENAYHRARWMSERAALQEQAELTRQLLNTTLDGYILADTQGQILDVNPAYCQMTGYSRDELIQMNVRDLEALHTPPEIEARIRDMVATGRARFETRHRGKDDRLIDLDVSITIIYLNRNSPLVATFVRDITAQKQTINELRRLKRFNESIVQDMTEGIFIEDAGGYFTFVNPAGAEMLGYTPDELVGRHWRDIIPADQQHVIQQKNEARRRGVADQYELELVTKGGERLTVLVSGKPRLDETTGQFEGTLAIITNITDRVKMERELRQRNRELELLNAIIAASAANLETELILETACRELGQTLNATITEALLLNDERTEATTAAAYTEPGQPNAQARAWPVSGNPVLEHLLNYKSPFIIANLAETEVAALAGYRQQGIHSLLAVPLVIDASVVGALVVESAAARQFSPDEMSLAWNVADQVAGALAQARLREERERLAEQYRQAQKLEAIGQLTSGIAHDFNNILTAINGYAEILQMQFPPNDPRREMTEHILNAGNRAAQLVRQLLGFSRKQIIQPEVLNLPRVIANLENMLRRVIREDIELITLIPSDLWPVKMDPSQVEQILLNLAINARDAMPNGGKLFITASNSILDEHYTAAHPDTPPGEYIQLAITDTGTGIPPEIREHIFEPFFTTKNRATGSGLGLSSVYGIVKQNGGEIEVYSEVGVGTTFKIYLPRYSEHKTAPAAPLAVPAPPPTGTEVILLAEDDAAVREFARETLIRHGYTVLEAANAPEALRRAEEYSNPIHLLITDVVMPGGSGQMLAEKLRQIRPGLKVLYISGYSEEMVAQHGLEAGHINFLPKPFSPTALLHKVRTVLDAAD